MSIEDGSNQFAPGFEPPKEDIPDQPDQKESEIIFKETYDGSEDPLDFLKHILEKAKAQGFDLSIEEIFRQAQKQAEEKGEEFSLDSLQEMPIKNIIFPGLVITLKRIGVPEEVLAEEDDDDDDDDEPRKKKKEEEGKKEAPKEEYGILDTDLKKIRTILNLNSDEGINLEGYLIKIKDQGKRLISALIECQGNYESDKAIGFRLSLFENLDAAEELGKTLKSEIEKEFPEIVLPRELVPIFLIKSYLKEKYQEQNINPIPKELLGIEALRNEESLTLNEVVEDRPK